MIGAIIGDTIGSIYEFDNHRSTEFELFSKNSEPTDDSMMTFATAEHLIYKDLSYEEAYRKWFWKYPDSGYGGRFRLWCQYEDYGPYNSWGNGSAMRVSPVGWIYNTLEETLEEAKKSAECSHNHPEGIKGAQATAAAIFMARNGASKQEIKDYIKNTFKYDLDQPIDVLRVVYQFNESCQETVPEAIICFLESNDFEDAIRLGVSIGGDTDTLCCITGAIAEAFYKEIPQEIIKEMEKRLDPEMKTIIKDFNEMYNINTKFI